MEANKCHVSVSSSRRLFDSGMVISSTRDKRDISQPNLAATISLPIESKRSTLYVDDSKLSHNIGFVNSPVANETPLYVGVKTSEIDLGSARRVKWVRNSVPSVTVDCNESAYCPIQLEFIQKVRCSRSHDSVDKIFLYEQTEFAPEGSRNRYPA